MSKSLGTLTLDMLVNLTGFKRGMQDAENQTTQSTNKMSSAFGNFGKSVNDTLANTTVGSWASDLQQKFAGVNGSALALSGTLAGMATGGAVLAFGAMSKIAIETAQANMELQKFANLANSSVISFQGLAGASELLGISQDKLADQLKDFNEKLGEFASVGSGGAKDFFEQIAVKTEKGAEGAKKLAKEMSAMNGVEALQKYVDKLEEAGVNQQQLSFYLESMGSDLTALAPILENGGKLWKDYQKALEEAGVITSEEAIEKSALLQAQTKALQLQFGAVKSTLAEQMMPTLSNLIAYFMNGTNASGQLSGVLTGLSAVAKGVAMVMVGLGSAIEGVVRFIRLAVENFAELGMTARHVFTAMSNNDFDGVTSALAHGFGNLKNNISAFGNDTFANVNRSMGAMGDILDSNTAKADGLAKSILAINQASQNSVKYNQTGYTAGIAQNKALNETDKINKSTSAKATKAVQATAARLNSDMEKAILWGASQLKIDPNHLASVISFETGGTFSTNARNPKSSGTGLIQFMDDADGKKDKLYWGMTRNQFGALPAMEQMRYAVKFFRGKGLKANASLGQVYDAVTGTGYRAGTEAYRLNQVWDANKDGYIAPGESVKSGAFKKHMKNWFPNGGDSYSLKLGEALNDVAKAEEKREQDLIKQAQEIYKARQSIVKQYMTDTEKMEFEHQQRLQDIAQAYTATGTETQEQLAQLEQQKQHYTQNEIARYQQQMMEFTNAENLKQVQFQKTILETQKGWLNVTDYAQRYFDLIRQEINLSNQPQEVKNALIQQSYAEQSIQQNSEREATWDKYQQRFNPTLENPYQSDMDLLKKAREQMLITEQEYHQQRLALQMNTSLAIGQDFAGSLMGLVSQSSSTYKRLFALQRSFAIGEAIMNMWKSGSKAYAETTGNVWVKAAAAAQAVAAQGQFVALLKSVAPVGMAHSGIDNIPQEGTWLLDKGERVLSPRQNADLTQFLQNQNRAESGQNIVINVVVNADNSSSVESNEQFGQAMGEAIKAAVLKIIQQEKRQGGMLA